MKTYTYSDRIKTIIADEHNRIFFKNASFHQDKGYKIVIKDNEEIFQVSTGHGIVHYKLDGSKICDYIRLAE